MFCSTCKTIETTLRDCRRKICPFGHVACENCGDVGDCPVCFMAFCNLVHIEFAENAPRLFITCCTNRAEEGTKPNKNQSDSESLQNLMKDLDEYEHHHGKGDAISVLSGCFEIVGGNVNSPFSISVDGDDEKELLNCFEIREKSPRNHQLETTEKSQSAKEELPNKTPKVPLTKDTTTETRSVHKFTHREIQTSVTYVVQDVSDKAVHLLGSSSNFSSSSKAVNNSMNNYYLEKDFDGSEIASVDRSSVYNIYKNQELVEDSETAHFTSLTVSRAGPSPPDTPPKKGIPSIGYRVKFASFYNLEHRIPAQMEPLSMFDIESEDSSDEVTSDRARKLPRFPVECPITYCESNNVPSDFCNHITIDHPYIEVIKAEPAKVINLEINSKTNANMTVCHRLLLVTNRITDIGYGTFENTLPIVLLTSNMSLRKVFGCSTKNSNETDENFFIFLVGVYQFPINYTITMWSHGRDDSEPTTIKTMSDSVFFMSKPLTPKKIAGNALTISHAELQALTNNGKQMLSCQIMFH